MNILNKTSWDWFDCDSFCIWGNNWGGDGDLLDVCSIFSEEIWEYTPLLSEGGLAIVEVVVADEFISN